MMSAIKFGASSLLPLNIFLHWCLALAFFCCCITHARADTAIDVHSRIKNVIIGDQSAAEDNIRETPGNAFTIDKTQWQSERAATIKDITDYTPGVFAQSRNGAESARLSIRGSGLANTFQGRGLRILQDGIPINTADGEFEFPVIDPWLIQFAEIYPGANALQFGGSNFGGALNFVTPTGLTDPGTTIRAEGGGFETLHGLLSYGKNTGKFDSYAALSQFHQDGFRDHNEQDTERLNANVGWQTNPDFSNRFYISHTKSEPEISGAISKSVLFRDPSQANPANIAGDYRRDLDITRIAHRSAWQGANNRIDTSLFYTYRELDNPVTTYEFQHNNDTGATLKHTYNFDGDQLTSGVNFYYGTADETRFRNVAGTPGAPILTRDLNATTTELYSEYQHLLANRLYGIAGTQVSYATRNINQEAPLLQAQNKNFTGFNPRIGLRYDFDTDTQYFSNLSRSFDPPTLNELSGGNAPGFNQLAAQRGTTFEIGTRSVYKNINYSVAYYHGRLQNEFVNYRFADGTTDTINASQTTRDGIELGLDGKLKNDLFLPNDNLTIRAAYTFNDFRLDDDPLYKNNVLPGVPEHYIRAETLYHHPSGVAFGPNVEWVPSAYPIDLTNSFYTKNYAIFGARIFWANDDGSLSLYAEGRNLANEDYIATANVVPNAASRDGRYFYPGDGRTFYAGLQIKF